MITNKNTQENKLSVIKEIKWNIKSLSFYHT